MLVAPVARMLTCDTSLFVQAQASVVFLRNATPILSSLLNKICKGVSAAGDEYGLCPNVFLGNNTN
jgi:hypothetical protein